MKMFGPLLVLLAIAGCADRAKPDLAKCIQLQIADDIGGAWEACNAAIKADPNSDSGRAAAAKLSEMKPKYDAWAAKAEKLRKKKAAAYAKARQDAEARRLEALRAKVKRTYWQRDKQDPDCLGKGLPPYKWSYEGGTYAEDQEAAAADGCVKPHPRLTDIMEFCCPQQPGPDDQRAF